jgi:hypothetical protein
VRDEERSAKGSLREIGRVEERGEKRNREITKEET